jgi:RNA polymerase sigma factor (TIGR02999 family)
VEIPLVAADFAHITALLEDVNEGREGADDRLMNAVYKELRRMANALVRAKVAPGRPGATLQATEIVHEAFIKLIKERRKYDRRGHFFTAFMTCMKQVLLDYVRRRKAAKRGGGWTRVALDPEDRRSAEGADIAALVEALDKLERLDPRKAEVVRSRLYCGLTNEEVAESLDISVATVERDWKFCRAWLNNEIWGEES